MAGQPGAAEGGSDSHHHHQRLEQVASAVEDLLYMGAITLADGQDAALISPQFSTIVSRVMMSADAKEKQQEGAEEAGRDEIMKLMYYSLMIYMNEHLKLPKALAMALGNDLENNRESMESGQLVSTYVSVLAEIWSQSQNRK